MPAPIPAPRYDHPKAVGDRSEAHVLAALVDAGYLVWTPWGENRRADFLIQGADGAYHRIQVKTGRLRNGAIKFRTCSTTYHHPNNQGTRYYKHDYRGDADLFGVYCPETRGTYLVPVDEVGVREGCLRVDKTRNRQRRGIRFASDYEVVPE